LIASVAVGGARVTVTFVCDVICIGIETAFSGAAAGVAVSVTEFGEGAMLGAVYVAVAPETLATTVPQVAFEHPAPEMDQEIARLGFEFGTGVSFAV